MKKGYGVFGSSIRYCIKCKQNQTFMPLKKGHSECLFCGNTYSKRPKTKGDEKCIAKKKSKNK